MVEYDKHYQTPNLFGKPYKELLDFFKSYPHRGHILDLGCGQGRDAIALAKLGYRVTAVDNSKIGIEQMLTESKKKGLKIKGVTADIYGYRPDEKIDIVLLDSMIHFGKKEIEKEKHFLKQTIEFLKSGGVICLCIRDTGKKIRTIKTFLFDTYSKWRILNDTILTYTYVDKASGFSSKTNYNMLIMEK
ncbi:MAG: class I SAM-dependent methyltransferase [Fulvivirga sp.]